MALATARMQNCHQLFDGLRLGAPSCSKPSSFAVSLLIAAVAFVRPVSSAATALAAAGAYSLPRQWPAVAGKPACR
jgi:hypothetical protein